MIFYGDVPASLHLPYSVVTVSHKDAKLHLAQYRNVTLCGRIVVNLARPFEFDPKTDCQTCRKIQEDKA